MIECEINARRARDRLETRMRRKSENQKREEERSMATTVERE